MMMDSAKRLAASGFRVFPCHYITEDGSCSCGETCSSPGKHPKTMRGFKDATTESLRIEGYWMHDRQANIGLATGGKVYVVDLDGDEGIDEWRQLQAQHGVVSSISVITGSGGRHVYLSMPDGIKLGNSAGKLAPHIDTRGDGGYVLAPPSNHISGRQYAWDLTSGKVLVVPGWIIAALEPKMYTPMARASVSYDGTTPYGAAILNRALDRVANAVNGSRNQTLAREAFVLGQWVAGGEISHAESMTY